MTRGETPATLTAGTAPASRVAAVLWIIGPLWYLVAEGVTALAFPGYSYADNYISDLGVPERGVLDDRVLDSPLHAVMNAGFVGEGVLFLIGLVLLLRHRGRNGWVVAAAVLGAVHSAGIIVVGLVPGSPANVDNGLIFWHGLGAVAAIGGGNLVAIIAGRALGLPRAISRVGQLLGALGFVSAALLVTHTLLPDGVWERGAVCTFMVWQLIAGISLLARRRTAAA